MSSDPSFKQQGHDRFTIYARLSRGKNVDDFIFIYLQDIQEIQDKGYRIQNKDEKIRKIKSAYSCPKLNNKKD